MRLKITFYTFIILLLGGLQLFVAPLYAQSISAVTIISPTQEIRLTRGQTYFGSLTVRNRTSQSAIVEVSVSNFIVTDTKGTPTLLPATDISDRFAAATWISLPQKLVTVPAKQQIAIPYTIHVPSNATSGGHYVSLVVRNVASDITSGSGAAVNVQVGSLFSLIVAGPITEKAALTSYTLPTFQEYGPVSLSASIRNLGDLHIRPTGAVHIANLFGKEVALLPLPEKNIFPDASKDYAFSFNDKLLLGPYTAKLMVTYGQHNQLSLVAVKTIWIIPWKMILIFFLALVALILGLLLLKKKINPPADHQPLPPTMPTSQPQ